MMSLYPFILVVHVTAVLVLCAVLSIELVSLIHLRGASTPAEAYPWVQPVLGIRFYAITSLLTILFTGVYLVIQESAFRQAWPKVAMIALFLMAPLGKLTGSRMQAIRNAFHRHEREMGSELLGRLRDPFLKISLGIRIGAFFGIFLLVSAKPRLWEAIALVGACAVLGVLSSFITWRRDRSLPVPGADLGD
jgi:hypothetical protein